MKIVSATFLLLLVSCGAFQTKSTKEFLMKKARANDLYERIKATIYWDQGFTKEFQAIEQKIMDGKDTLFMLYGDDYQILITRKKPSSPVETVRVVDTVTRIRSSW